MHEYESEADKEELRTYKHAQMWLKMFCLCFGVLMTNYMLSGYGVEIYKIKYRTIISSLTVMHMIHMSMVYLTYLSMPWSQIGWKGEAVVDIITLVSPTVLRLYSPYDGSDLKKASFVFLVLITFQLYFWLDMIHSISDVFIVDVLLRLLVEVVIYISGDTTCVFLVILFSCVICYKYFFYSAPLAPDNHREHSELLPV